MYEKVKDQAEIMNKSLREVITEESEQVEKVFKELVLRYIIVEVHKIKKIMHNLNVKKAQGTDEISNWVLKECR